MNNIHILICLSGYQSLCDQSTVSQIKYTPIQAAPQALNLCVECCRPGDLLLITNSMVICFGLKVKKVVVLRELAFAGPKGKVVGDSTGKETVERE